MNDMLPVGSKVRLKDGRIRLIIGYLPSKPNDAVWYDYVCCRDIYGIMHKKEDLILDRDYFYINPEDILDILYIGYSDNQFDLFMRYTNILKEKLKESKKSNKDLTQEELDNIYSGIFDKITSGN